MSSSTDRQQPPAAAASTPRSGDAATQRVEAIRSAVLAVPGVAGLHSGRFGEVATYLPGGKIGGIRSRPDIVEVHLITQWDLPIPRIVDEVRAAIARLPDLGKVAVQVVVEDITDAEQVGAPGTPGPPVGVDAS